MFTLFVTLYYSMFVGAWRPMTIDGIRLFVEPCFNTLGEFFTSIFNNVDTPMTTLGTFFGSLIRIGEFNYNPVLLLVAYILALITSIGIVFMAVKGVKRIFGVFFYGVR